MSQGSLNPKIRSRSLGQKVCSVARVQTDRQADIHESEYRGHPFRISGICPSIIKDRPNKAVNHKCMISMLYCGFASNFNRGQAWAQWLAYLMNW